MSGRHYRHSMSPPSGYSLSAEIHEMSAFYTPAAAHLKKASPEIDTSDCACVETDSEVSDEAPRRIGRWLRLTSSDKALIRFLSKADVTPPEIRAEFGWALKTINKYENESGRKDKRYITPTFARILRDIQSAKKKDDSNRLVKPKATQKRGKGKRRRSTDSQASAGPKTRSSIREKGQKHTNSQLPCNAQEDSDSDDLDSLDRTPTDQDFLGVQHFVVNAGLDPGSEELLKTSGLTSVKKLRSVADLGKKKVEAFVRSEFVDMTSVDKILLIGALDRLANSVQV
ncbi:hypothetical protein C8R45DRAFT_1212685 [Mycena sanguinolenta]|nr:hypothetical protein C8R45DRAFT_1212685 [Mycena sanguinolenta]